MQSHMQSTPERVSILDVLVDPVTMNTAVERLAEFISRYQVVDTANGVPPKLAHIVTANSEIVMMAVDDPEMAHILQEAALVVADGIGLVWAARLVGKPVPERVAGIDLMDQLLARCAKEGWRPFFLGAAPGIAEEAQTAQIQRHPSLKFAGSHHGYFSADEDAEVIETINASKPDLLLVALGAPRAEKWINAHRNELHVPVVVGVGGSFDVWAGKTERAPRWMCEAGLEWSYRLIKQPSRALRMMALPRFAAAVLWGKWRRK